MKETGGKIIDFLEERQRQKREGYRWLLRLLHTVAGELLIGLFFLALSVASFVEANAQQEKFDSIRAGSGNGNIVITVEGNDGSVLIEGNNIPIEIPIGFAEQQAKEKSSRNYANGVFCVVLGAGCLASAVISLKKKKNAATESAGTGTFEEEDTSIERETEEDIHTPVETSAPDNGRQENLRRLYEAGILSREEYLARKKKR